MHRLLAIAIVFAFLNCTDLNAASDAAGSVERGRHNDR
jgi:hypothetical protein